ncbi:MAG: RagB/SusD family nutrient uptake outer membrane protein [Chitinophagaceae bacterium]|nr:MAG: RagB/SusD family nutrient uptake outer membrane protein [Chitinophagaceae bacterium]
MKKSINILGVFLLLLVLGGCKKDYLDTKPSNAVPESTIFATTTDINAALDGAYQSLFAYGANGTTGHDNFGQKAVDLSLDLAGQDMVVHLAGYGWFNRDYQYAEWNLKDASNRRPEMVFFYYYEINKQANKFIKFVDAAIGSEAEKKAIKGQALALRAYCHYYLVNLWAQTYKGHESDPGIPVVLTDVPGPEGTPRSSVQDVYTQIIADLTDAETALTGTTMPDKVHISLNVVQGLRARVALVMEDWPAAALYANKARTGYVPMTGSQYTAAGAFSSISNPEWMWGSKISADLATIYASFFSHMDAATGGYAALGTQKKITKALYDQIPATDVRKTLFRAPGTGTSTFPDYNQSKHRVPLPGGTTNWVADYLYMRAAEMYLIEAEALARQGQDGPAGTVLNALVSTRNPAYTGGTLTGTALLNEILLQRRIELWGEGFGLLDIKRLKTGLNRPTGAGNHGSPSLDPVVYTLADADPRMIMKIPQNEINNNPALTDADQNP